MFDLLSAIVVCNTWSLRAYMFEGTARGGEFDKAVASLGLAGKLFIILRDSHTARGN